MFPKDHNEENPLFYNVGDDGEFRSLKDITSIEIKLSEQDAAKLWALFEGLEIVNN